MIATAVRLGLGVEGDEVAGWEPKTAAEREICATAEALEPYIGRLAEISSDADNDDDLTVLLYPADVAKLLALIASGADR